MTTRKDYLTSCPNIKPIGVFHHFQNHGKPGTKSIPNKLQILILILNIDPALHEGEKEHFVADSCMVWKITIICFLGLSFLVFSDF